jgi:hypothetical protein
MNLPVLGGYPDRVPAQKELKLDQFSFFNSGSSFRLGNRAGVGIRVYGVWVCNVIQNWDLCFWLGGVLEGIFEGVIFGQIGNCLKSELGCETGLN